MPLISDFKNESGKWVRSVCVNYKQSYTKSNRVWSDIAQRCLVGGYQQARFPRYIGCTMSENFQDFQYFAEWCQSQVGYGLDKYHIDKDILVEGNKEYHENRCVFVPPSLNTFLVSHNASRGLYPQGVAFHPLTEKYSASVMIERKAKHLGLFLTPEDAFVAYKEAKEALARKWYLRLKNGEFIVDPRVIERMRTWELKDKND